MIESFWRGLVVSSEDPMDVFDRKVLALKRSGFQYEDMRGIVERAPLSDVIIEWQDRVEKRYRGLND